MKLTDGLLGEHALFHALLERFEGVVHEAHEVDELRAVSSVLGGAVITHAELEEKLLLGSLEAAGQAVGPVGVMRAEHTEIDDLLHGVATATSLDSAREGCLALLDLLREHFRKEEQVLFPMSEAVLGEEKLLALGESWASERFV
jgi:iron-sulfur cluster repair protein YtfE (RIC family)